MMFDLLGGIVSASLHLVSGVALPRVSEDRWGPRGGGRKCLSLSTAVTSALLRCRFGSFAKAYSISN